MKEIPSAFMNYFENKVSQLRDRIGLHPHSCEIDVHNVMPTNTLAEFDPVSPGDIIALVKQSSPKSCELDILPHGVLKNCIHILAPFLADLFNNFVHIWHYSESFHVSDNSPIVKEGRS